VRVAETCVQPFGDHDQILGAMAVERDQPGLPRRAERRESGGESAGDRKAREQQRDALAAHCCCSAARSELR
jgi:hypothetical protein